MGNPVKGLLIKDLCFMKSQKSFLAMAVAVFVIFNLTTDKADFILSYIVMLCAMLVTSTISNDESDNGMSFLFTLPILKKDYVREKYILGFIMTVSSWLMMCLISYIMQNITHVTNTTGTSIIQYMAEKTPVILTSCLFLAVQLPMRLKFVNEKSSYAVIITMATIGIIIYLAAKYMEIAEYITGVIQYKLNTRAGGFITWASLLAFTAAAELFSYIISLKIMQKREF